MIIPHRGEFTGSDSNSVGQQEKLSEGRTFHGIPVWWKLITFFLVRELQAPLNNSWHD
jgi:hypothetical protein